MFSNRSYVISAFAVLLVACTTVNVDPGANGALDKATAGDDAAAPSSDPSKTGSSSGDPGAPDGSKDPGSPGSGSDAGSINPGGGGGDAGMINPGGGDAGSGDSGGGLINSGGDGGGDAGGAGGGGVITANNNNWVGWADSTQCPAWNPAPSAWKESRTWGVGSLACSGAGFYDAFLGPNATAATQATWSSFNAACKTCAISDWSDPAWGPIVRTPNGHYILNQGGCYALSDPGRRSCGLSSWEFDQCGAEACDSAGTSQATYRQCVANTTFVDGLCGKAAIGDGRSDNVIFTSGSPAYGACYATGFGDNDNQATMRVIQAFCY